MNDYMIYIDDSIILGTCISIIISTLALTVPLLLQMMSRINTQYNSVVLIDFFIKEKNKGDELMLRLTFLGKLDIREVTTEIVDHGLKQFQGMIDQ